MRYVVSTLLVTTLFAGTALAADWQKIGGDAKASLYMDTSTYRRELPLTYAHTKVTNAGGMEVDEMTMDVALNCDNKTWKMTNTVVHHQGQSIPVTDGVPTDFRPLNFKVDADKQLFDTMCK